MLSGYLAMNNKIGDAVERFSLLLLIVTGTLTDYRSLVLVCSPRFRSSLSCVLRLTSKWISTN